MQWVYGLVISFFGEVLKVALKYVTKRFAIGVAVVATFLALTSWFLLGLKGLILGLGLYVPDALLIPWGWVMPSNFLACLSAIISAETFHFIYRQKIVIDRILFPYGKF